MHQYIYSGLQAVHKFGHYIYVKKMCKTAIFT
jgi:hypothetical protein